MPLPGEQTLCTLCSIEKRANPAMSEYQVCVLFRIHVFGQQPRTELWEFPDILTHLVEVHDVRIPMEFQEAVLQLVSLSPDSMTSMQMRALKSYAFDEMSYRSPSAKKVPSEQRDAFLARLRLAISRGKAVFILDDE